MLRTGVGNQAEEDPTGRRRRGRGTKAGEQQQGTWEMGTRRSIRGCPLLLIRCPLSISVSSSFPSLPCQHPTETAYPPGHPLSHPQKFQPKPSASSGVSSGPTASTTAPSNASSNPDDFRPFLSPRYHLHLNLNIGDAVPYGAEGALLEPCEQ